MTGAVFQIPGLDLAIWADVLAGFFFAMLRIGAFLIASPAFGGRYVPVPIRIVAAVCLTLPVADVPGLPSADEIARMTILPKILSELAVGLMAGLMLSILFGAAGMAGDRIANAAGLGFAMQVDPSAGGQSPVVAQIFGLAMLMVFFATDAHLIAIRIVLESYAAFPPGSPPALGPMILAGVGTGSAMFALASALMLPVVGGLLILNLSVGVITRSAPQLNLFSVGFPLAIIAALVLLWMTVPQMAGGMLGISDAGLSLMRDLFAPVEP